MNLVDTVNSPSLQPPGAGLPKLELVVARLLLRLARWRGDKDADTARFQHERAAVRALVAGCNPEMGLQRVLIRRVAGMEDSSRFWSVWMTLDHLRIIHLSFAGVIGALIKGNVPPGKASTAAVKPSREATAEVVAPYEASCDALLASAAAAPDLKTKARYVHPWFGPLDAAAWYGLAGVHLKIHREQIRRIIAIQTANGESVGAEKLTARPPR